MRPVYLEYNKAPYLYDLDGYKLYKLKENNLLEVDNQMIISDLRLKALEISQEDAMRLLHASTVQLPLK